MYQGPVDKSFLRPRRLVDVLASKPHLSTTVLNLMQKHSLQPSAVRRVVLTYPSLFNLDDEVVKLRPHVAVCPSYNETGECDGGEQCEKLHYLKDVCVVDSCFRNHDWSVQPNARILFNLFLEELDNDVLCKLVQLVMKDSQTTADQPWKGASVWTMGTEGEVKVQEICYESVEGLCLQESAGCRRLHATRHYHWQARENDCTWFNLEDPQVEALERSFCDPAQEDVLLPPSPRHRFSARDPFQHLGHDTWRAEFDGMTLTNSSGAFLFLRRLCTEEKEDTYIPARTYLWYFQKRDNDWKLYGSSVNDVRSNVTSEEIENEFKNGSSGMAITADTHTFTISFADMTQTNDDNGSQRKVRRRPMPHLDDNERHTPQSPSDEDDESSVYLSLVSREASPVPTPDTEASPVPTPDVEASTPDIPLPVTWHFLKVGEEPRLVTLNPYSEEYKEVWLLLQPLIKSKRVERIRRVQNPLLWRTFQRRLLEMPDIYGGGEPSIRQLFHGTTKDALPKILTSNLDWTLQAEAYGNKRWYGRGVYFFSSAERAFRYSVPDVNDRWFLVVAQVAVGGVARGNVTMEAPPTDDDARVACDTTVDNTDAPTVLVKYHKEEYFPQYIITFS